MSDAPRWAERLRARRTEEQWSQCDLAVRMAKVSSKPLAEVESVIRAIRSHETGKTLPNDFYAELYRRVYDVPLSTLLGEEPALSDEAVDRLAYVADAPRRLDAAVMPALADALAAQRRVEDVIGSAPLIGAVTAQLDVVQPLVIEARGALRQPMLDVAGQWAQFAGWLNANSQRPADANRWYDRALEWGTESGDRNMIATAMSMKGHLGWIAGRPGPLIGLSQAAQRDRGVSPGVRALAAQQEARGHALAGEREPADRRLDEAAQLALSAGERPEEEPPWVYFFGHEHYLIMQRGLAYCLLGRYVEAITLIQRGLDALPDDLRRSEWSAQYLLHIADAHAAMGDVRSARSVAATVDGIARATASSRLCDRLRRLDARLASRS